MPVPATDPVADALLGETRANIKPGYPFLLVHHTGKAGSWECVDLDGRPTWLPVLAQIPLMPGANGVRTVEKGEAPSAAWDGLTSSLNRDGAVIIPANAEVCGVRYMVPQSVLGGTRYRMWCEVIEPNPMPGRKELVTFDHAVYNVWRAKLVTDGKIPAPHSAVLRQMIKAADNNVSRWKGHRTANPDVRAENLALSEAAAKRLADATLPGAKPAKKAAA